MRHIPMPALPYSTLIKSASPEVPYKTSQLLQTASPCTGLRIRTGTKLKDPKAPNLNPPHFAAAWHPSSHRATHRPRTACSLIRDRGCRIRGICKGFGWGSFSETGKCLVSPCCAKRLTVFDLHGLRMQSLDLSLVKPPHRHQARISNLSNPQQHSSSALQAYEHGGPYQAPLEVLESIRGSKHYGLKR